MTAKECRSDQILNPKTNRCVSKTGTVGLALLNPKEQTVECKSHQILNPKTGRCVSKTGKVGLALIDPTKSVRKKSVKIESVEEPPIPLASYGCNKIGMMQSIGTCWFNSIFNNLLLSQRCYSFFLNKYNQLPEADKKIIRNKSLDNICPIKLQRYNFYYYFYKYHLNRSKIMDLVTMFFRPKNAQKLINKLDIRSPEWEKIRQGFHPDEAIPKILPIIMDSDEYTIHNVISRKTIITTKKTKFIFIRSYIAKITDPRIKIPQGFILDHTVIVINFGHGNAHAISGYICNDEYYIYDSNNFKHYKLDWRDTKNIETHGFLKLYTFLQKNVKLTISYSYLCYIRKN